MQVRVLITTPEGCAKHTEEQLRRFILIGHKKPFFTAINDNDSEVAWLIEGTPKDVFKLTRAVCMYYKVANMVTSNNIAKKSIQLMTGATKEQMLQLKDALSNNTKVEVVKYATAQELVNDEKSIFSKIRDKIHI